ncbi:MAG: hypothetical protein HKO62_03490, partial [Gammaproteobacteria bacterium]|nr:hypothetical protein [Gammaproteobacteria bacterium]
RVSVVPFSLLEVGEEYASALEFDPSGLVLSGGALARVPVTARALAVCACALGSAGLLATFRRR